MYNIFYRNINTCLDWQHEKAGNYQTGLVCPKLSFAFCQIHHDAHFNLLSPVPCTVQRCQLCQFTYCFGHVSKIVPRQSWFRCNPSCLSCVPVPLVTLQLSSFNRWKSQIGDIISVVYYLVNSSLVLKPFHSSVQLLNSLSHNVVQVSTCYIISHKKGNRTTGIHTLLLSCLHNLL